MVKTSEVEPGKGKGTALSGGRLCKSDSTSLLYFQRSWRGLTLMNKANRIIRKQHKHPGHEKDRVFIIQLMIYDRELGKH